MQCFSICQCSTPLTHRGGESCSGCQYFNNTLFMNKFVFFFRVDVDEKIIIMC